MGRFCVACQSLLRSGREGKGEESRKLTINAANQQPTGVPASCRDAVPLLRNADDPDPNHAGHVLANLRRQKC